MIARYCWRHILSVPVILLSVLTWGSCQKSPVEPIRNPREYTWTVTEISSPNYQVLLEDVWGSSSSNVYVVGASGSVRTSKMFHFNGVEWREVEISFLGSSQVGFNLHAVHGFGPNNIWAVGEYRYFNPNPPPTRLDSTLIIWSNGSSWNTVQPVSRKRGLYAIGGFPDNLWFGGFDESLFHFDGVNIAGDSLFLDIETDSADFRSNIQSITGESADMMYALIFAPIRLNSIIDRYYVYQGGAGGWSLMDSIMYSFRSSLWKSPEGQLYLTGDGLYLRTGSTWATILDPSHEVLCVFGTNSNNIFAGGGNGKLYHFNGVDWFQFKGLENSSLLLLNIWTDGKEVFVVGHDGFKSYIAHGK